MTWERYTDGGAEVPVRRIAAGIGLVAILALAVGLSATAAAQPADGSPCDDVEVRTAPADPTSRSTIYVNVTGVSGAEVRVQWTLTAPDGDVADQGTAWRESSDEDVFRLDPLGPFERDHAFQANATAEFSLGRSCQEITEQIPISNSPPTGAVDVEPTSFVRGETVTFRAHDVADADGDDVDLTWRLDGETAADGADWSRSFDDVTSHEVALALDDGHTTRTIERTVQARNRLPQLGDVTVDPSTVVRNQSVHVTWDASDPDADAGYDTLRTEIVYGDHAVEPDGSNATVRFKDAGVRTVTVRVTDGLVTVEARRNVTVHDRTAPQLASDPVAPQHAILQVPAGDGERTAVRDGHILRHTWPATGPDDLAARIQWARTADVQAVVVEDPPSQTTADLRDALRQAEADGILVAAVAPAPSRDAFNVDGMAARSDVLTVAYGPDADDIRTGLGPAPDLAAKPDVAVEAASRDAAADRTAALAEQLVRQGVADPLAVDGVLRSAADPAHPHEAGAGIVSTLPDRTPLLPAVPTTSYLDLGVVNDDRAAAAKLPVLNPNGLSPRLADAFDGHVPSKNVTVHVNTTYYHAGDVLREGFASIARAERANLTRYELTQPLSAEVTPAQVNVTPIEPNVTMLARDVDGLQSRLDDRLQDNDFDDELTLDEWDRLADAARSLDRARDGLDDANASDLGDRLGTMRSSARTACDVVDDDPVCTSADEVVDEARDARDELTRSIGNLADGSATTTLRLRSDPAATADAPRGLYVGYATIRTEAGDDTAPGPVRVPTAMLVTGTTTVQVSYPGGQPVPGTTVEAVGDGPQGSYAQVGPAGVGNPVDPVANLFVTVPTGFHVRTDDTGQARLDHLAPLGGLDGISDGSAWSLGGYYDAPLRMMSAHGQESSIPVLSGSSSNRSLYGPSTTAMAEALGRDVAGSLPAFVLSNLDPVDPGDADVDMDRYDRGRQLLDRDVDADVDVEVPAGVYSRVVDEVPPDAWRTGTLDDGTSGDVDEVQSRAAETVREVREQASDRLQDHCPSEAGDRCAVPPVVSSASDGWVWTTRGDDLHGVSTHGSSAGVARYRFAQPDAEYMQLGVQAEVGRDTRGLAYMIATVDNRSTEQLDAFLHDGLELDATEPGQYGQAAEAIARFAAGSGHGTRVLPLTAPAAQVLDGVETPTATSPSGERVVLGAATEFTLEERRPDTGALTVLVLPTPVGSPDGDGPAVGAPLGGEITLDVSTRIHSYRPVEPGSDGSGYTFANRVPHGQAESWDTVLSVPSGHGVEIDGETPTDGIRVEPATDEGSRLGHHPLATWWHKARDLDTPPTRGYVVDDVGPHNIVEWGSPEDTCRLEPVFPGPEPRRDGSGLCLKMSVAGNVRVGPVDPDGSEASAGLSIHVESPYEPHRIGYLEDRPGICSAAIVSDEASTCGYVPRRTGRTIHGVGGAHDFVVLRDDALRDADPVVTVETVDETSLPERDQVMVRPWDHGWNPPETLG